METMNKLGRILLVEDDPKDVELTLAALEEYNLARFPRYDPSARKADLGADL